MKSIQHVCSANELAQARAACPQADASSCPTFFQFEKATNPACASCLAPFDVPYNEVSGIATCTAPFVDTSCNHDTGCLTDCEAQSCGKCPAGSADQCRTDAQSNQCSAFAGNINCAFNALFGAASFCNPQNYPNFGGWLQGVGGHYCGP
jgi:hypothetical protein